MKKIFGMMFCAVAAMTLLCGAKGGCDDSDSVERREQDRNIETAHASIPIPRMSYYQERRTISKWAQRWDTPNLPCYVYLVSYGKIIGYYVTNGKPSSTRSYILPEVKHNLHGDGGCCLEPTADLDGTYGQNNPGIRFFTAEGTAVEWGGSGASYLYSDAPLPINVPLLNTKRGK